MIKRLFWEILSHLNIDLNIHGVGGDDTWGAKTMDKYTHPGNRPYQYGFILEYIDGNRKRLKNLKNNRK